MTLNLQVHCPYCKRPVSAPVAMVGQRIMCPSCRAEIVLNPSALLVPAGAARGGNEAATPPPLAAPLPPPVTAHPPAAVPPPAAPLPAPPPKPLTPYVVPAPPVRNATEGVPYSAPPQAVPPPAAQLPAAQSPAPPPVGSNTAKFLAATPQGPAITSTSDGKLPTLQLADSPDAKVAPAEGQSQPVPLWLALLLVAGSTVISLLLVTHDFDGSQANATTKAQARRQLTAFYGDDLTPLAPFQVHLREAQLAHSRGDFTAERDRYRRVLALVRAEGRSQFEGLTGTPDGDKELARLLAILLAD
jgi:hypothetical protein